MSGYPIRSYPPLATPLDGRHPCCALIEVAHLAASAACPSLIRLGGHEATSCKLIPEATTPIHRHGSDDRRDHSGGNEECWSGSSKSEKQSLYVLELEEVQAVL